MGRRERLALTAHHSNDAIALRVVGADDWLLWRSLRLEALEEAAYAFTSTLADWQGEGDTELRWRNRLSTIALNIVAYRNGKAAGMVSGTAPNHDGTVELISMWVAPFARGRRVGDALVGAMIEWARTSGATGVALEVFESNDRAVTLYRRNRFIDVGAGANARRRMALPLD